MVTEVRKAPKSPVNPAKALAGAAGLVAVMTLISRIFGFGRWLAQATWVGAGTVGNAYASANQIPNVIFEVVVGGALASVTVPLLATAIAGGLKEEVNKMASALLTWTLTILLPLGLLIFLGADLLVGILPESVGSDAVTQNRLASFFLKIFSLQIPLYGVAVVLGGVLQAHHRFAWPAIMPAFSSIVTIITYWGYDALAGGNPTDSSAITVLAWGTTCGVIALSVPLFIPVYRTGVKLRITWKMPPEKIRQALTLGAYGIGALVAAQGYILATLFLTRWGGVEGTINVFQYSQAIYMLPYALFTFPVATVVFPLLTRRFAEGAGEAVHALAGTSTALISGLALLGIAGLVAVAPGMAAIFSWNHRLEGLEQAVCALAPALLGYALLYHLSRVFIATDHASHSLWAALIGWSVAAFAGWGLILVLAPQRGDGVATLIALGLGNALGMTIAGIYLLIRWNRVHPGAPLQVVKSLAIALPGSLLGAFLGRFTYLGLDSLNLPLGVLWATLGAGIVTVACALPGLKVIATPFRKLTRPTPETRHDVKPGDKTIEVDTGMKEPEENPETTLGRQQEATPEKQVEGGKP